MDKKALTRREFLGLKKFADSESGASAIEYGLIASLIGGAIVLSLRRTGNRTRRKFVCVRKGLRNQPLPAHCK